ncbi:MAG TPA: aspartate aminotransferase family protein [Solirubrobacteraceae bacterium]|nr:aspartate aminotransferase family protein [Solirubrobacteraceae bacterium]
MLSHPGTSEGQLIEREDTTALWHPFADMSSVPDREVVMERGEGVWVYDQSGKRYLDASAGLWYCNVGHGRKALAEAAAQQMGLLAGYQIFDVIANRPALDLAERVRALAPLGDHSGVFFTSGGSDSVDTAAKIARRYWVARGEPQRQIIICREGAYHGVNAFGTSLSGIKPNAAGWGSLVTQVLRVGRDDLAGLERALEEHEGSVAAFIGEPVQAAAGVFAPSPGYWDGVKDLCRRRDVLLIADEVVTGFGRLGRWFGSERYDIQPDMIVCAKGLSSGYMPVGAVIVADGVREALWSAQAGAFRHGYTYSGHPAGCAVALANIDIIENEGLVERTAQMESVLRAELGALAPHPLVQEVRVAGLLCGVELSAEARQNDPTLVERVVVDARSRGVLVRNLLGATLQISPPLVIEPQELRLLADTLRESLDAVAGG